MNSVTRSLNKIGWAASAISDLYETENSGTKRTCTLLK